MKTGKNIIGGRWQFAEQPVNNNKFGTAIIILKLR